MADLAYGCTCHLSNDLADGTVPQMFDHAQRCPFDPPTSVWRAEAERLRMLVMRYQDLKTEISAVATAWRNNECAVEILALIREERERWYAVVDGATVEQAAAS